MFEKKLFFPEKINTSFCEVCNVLIIRIKYFLKGTQQENIRELSDKDLVESAYLGLKTDQEVMQINSILYPLIKSSILAQSLIKFVQIFSIFNKDELKINSAG